MNDLEKRRSTQLKPQDKDRTVDLAQADFEQSGEMGQILSTLRRRKFLILLVAILVVIPAAVLTFLATPQYRSVVIVEIDAEPVRVLPYKDVTELLDGETDYELYMKTQDQVLKGPTLASRVEDRLRGDLTPAEFRETLPVIRSLDVQRVENTKLFQLSCVAPAPELAARVVNTFAEEYIKQHFHSRQGTREKARDFLERELADLRERVQGSEKLMVEYARNNNMQNLDQDKPNVVTDKLAFLGQQVSTVEADLITARSNQASLEDATLENFPEHLITPVISNLMSQQLQLEHDLTSLRQRFGEKWPAVIQKRVEMELAKKQLVQQKAAAIAAARHEARLELQTAESRYRMLSDSFNRQQQLVNQLNEASIQYNILRRDVETNEQLYEGLLERLKQTSVTAGLEFGNVHVVEPGRKNPEVYSPRVVWNLALATLLGLAMGVCIAFVSDAWDTSLSSLEEAERLLALPALGIVPEVRHLDRRRSAANKKQLSERTIFDPKSAGLPMVRRAVSTNGGGTLPADVRESFRGICASILLSCSDQAPQSILVTSAIPGEGKTSLVAQLGRTLAENGSRTVLVELDLRKPVLAKSFGFGEENGLSLFLSGHVSPLPMIHQTDVPNLHVISAGPRPPNPLALLQSERLEFLLRKLTETFRFVLIDSPPLLTVADARILGSKVDGSVLVVRAGKTPRKLVLRARASLQHAGANVIGMILNGANPKRDDSYYYRYYRDSSYYGSGHSSAKS